MNPLVILSGGKDALLARETFVTDIYIYIYIYKKQANYSSKGGSLAKYVRYTLIDWLIQSLADEILLECC